MDQRHGFVSMLAVREDIDMGIADQSPPYTSPLDLPSCPASDLVTPDAYAQACADEICFVASCYGSRDLWPDGGDDLR